MRNILRYIMTYLTVLCPILAYSAPLPLKVDQAFTLTMQREAANRIEVRFTIAEGYLIYAHSIRIKYNNTVLSLPILTNTKVSSESVQMYTDQASLYFNHVSAFSAKDSIQITWQGCSKQGVCYLPQVTHFIVGKEKGITLPQKPVSLDEHTSVSWVQYIENPNFSGPVWQTLLFFYLAGVLLAFTACMYPLIPIISSLIVGQFSSHRRAFLLSFVYVETMAMVYALAGGLAAWSGDMLSSYIQNRWVTLTFSGLFVLMALSMFGVFQLQLPQTWQSWLVVRTQFLPRGQYFSAALLGGVSALLISPCVAPPLVAALAYIGKEGNVIFGMSSLYMIAMGIGTPLLVIGMMGQKLLPRLQPKIMKSIQGLFGFILLAVALWIARLELSHFWWMLSLGVLFLMMAVVCYRSSKTIQSAWVRGAFIVMSTLLGLMVSFIAVTKEQEIQTPLSPVISIDSISMLSYELASHQGKKILLYFTADWCTACKKMTHSTFSDGRIKTALKDWAILKVDLTSHTKEKKALLKAFEVYGPPVLLFFDSKGTMLSRRLVGYQHANDVLQTLDVIEREAV